ncbi:conserved hypothetical protein, partial [Trichinella spiralis]|uniref:hypothetical protein n=1 Tax=Trichinella spiralis TaxID=6334 RepID=UPI0001EFD2F5
MQSNNANVLLTPKNVTVAYGRLSGVAAKLKVKCVIWPISTKKFATYNFLMVTARDGGKEEIIKIIRNVVVNATVNGPGRDGLIKSILDLEKSVQHTLMLIIQV